MSDRQKRRTIWKYLLDIKDGVQDVGVPGVSKIIATRMMGNTIAIWFIVNPDREMVTRRFIVYGTGHAHNLDYIHDYIGTCLHRVEQTTKMLVWHVFEVYTLG